MGFANPWQTTRPRILISRRTNYRRTAARRTFKAGGGCKNSPSAGPLGEHAIETVEHVTTMPLGEIDRLLVGCQIRVRANGPSHTSHTGGPISRETMRQNCPTPPARIMTAKNSRSRMAWPTICRVQRHPTCSWPPRKTPSRMSSTSPAKCRRCGVTLSGSSPAPTPIAKSPSSSPPIHSSQKAKACSAAKRHVYAIRCSGFSATNSAVPRSA